MSRSRPKAASSAKPISRRRKQLFREAALKNIAILRLIENTLHAKRDHAIGEEFFRDILDEHFSTDEVERQFQTALNWGRYAEIFDYDSENGRLFHREDADVLPGAEEALMARSTWQPVQHSGQRSVVAAAGADLVGADRLLPLRRGPVGLLRSFWFWRAPGSGRSIRTSRSRAIRRTSRSTPRIRCCASPSPTSCRSPSRWSTATSPRTTRAPSAS